MLLHICQSGLVISMNFPTGSIQLMVKLTLKMVIMMFCCTGPGEFTVTLSSLISTHNLRGLDYRTIGAGAGGGALSTIC